ncbi:LysR family transcriptional regulator, partial [Mycolicibacterium sp.]
MHLDELQWFVVLAETEHVTDAAAELGISQPTLSRALVRLEEQVGVPLFDRVNRRLRLNAYGHILLEHARRSISEIRSATERIAELRDPDTGTVRLAFLHSQAGWYVPDLLRRFRTEAPRVRFELFQGAAHEIVERLAGGEADLAITSPRPEGFRWRGLYM